MRIGVDLFALQAQSCRGRGIGRYAGSLLRALLVEAPDWEFVFYRRHDLPIDWHGELDDKIEWIDIGPDPKNSPDGTLQQIVQANPRRLDWLLILNPVVERREFAIPEPVAGGPQLAAVFYDLIPALFPKHYLAGEGLARQYDLDLHRLQSYDLLAAISEATGRDLHDRLRIPRHRIANIRGAVDPGFFRPAIGEESEQDAQILGDHGVREPFFYYLGNVDYRKNVLGLVDAYALLPEEIQASHPLVLTFGENAWFRAVLKEKIEQLHLGDRVIGTGPADDLSVRAFYRRALLFLSPSLYEGFGLPILEAMHCGAAVVVADNSSQPEVIGTAGVLARSGDSRDWAATIADLVQDPARIERLRASALIQAARFSWKDSAQRLKSAIEISTRRDGKDLAAHFSIVPIPSANAAGFSPEATRRFEALCHADRPTIFFETERATELPPMPMASCWYEKSLLTRVRPILGNPPVLYWVDSIEDFESLILDLEANPGTVVFCGDQVTARDDDLRRMVCLASAVTCHSEGLYRRILALAGEEWQSRVHLAENQP